jgi:ATP-dependent helicase/nuclease subunit A
MSARVPPESVLTPQRTASDPAVSAWVAANAGSGKTHVLAQRVIRLLLDGVAPSKILCITFTKAAAANMATRVFDTLAEWTRLDDDALDQKIESVGTKPTAPLRARARQLFALALETPGGLKVQTIHAFCTRLLHQFPFESDVAARFTVLDETTERQLLDQLSLGVMLEGTSRPDSPLGRSLAVAIASAADQTFRDVVNEAIRMRDAMTRWRGHAGDVDKAIDQLSETLGLSPQETIEGIEAEFFSASHIPETEWSAVIAALNDGSKSDQTQADRLTRVAQMRGGARVDAYLSIFFTGDFSPRKNLVTRATAQKYPSLPDRLAAEQVRAGALLDKRRAAMCRDRSAALLRVADAVIARYTVEKERRGLLDYDDLIEKTLALFANTSAAWVLFKLDLGIDHVLIDEAQDTSPAQWEIIQKLVGEFTAGAGARSVRRTLFAVGDDKQSIFSFQGAAPQKFDEMHRTFEMAFTGAELQWEAVKLLTSFRSGANILGAVDTVFGREQAYAGLSADRVATVHQALPDAVPGNVEIWELIKPEERPEIEGWDAPFDTLRETTPRVRLARKISKHVGALIKSGTPVGHARRPVRAGDILILVRQRGSLFEAIIRALKRDGIAVAGADRLILTEHIAVMDLIALADALLLPEDDLALATVLKSPLFRINEEELFEVAWKRKGSLRAALESKRSDLLLNEAALRLERCAHAARTMTPFGFYAWLLGPEGGRKRILGRLGHEAADALDEFLNLALDYESRETPSLQGFVAWLRAARAVVKRDMELARDEVRVMTVHGAKGLEAPVVYLADTVTPPAGIYPPRLLPLPLGDGVPDCIAWAVAKRHDVPPLRGARDRALAAAEDEYRRLLYVAMTRAADRLIVCGAEGVRRRPPDCWYDLVFDALAEKSIEVQNGEEKLWLYRKDEERSASVFAPAPLAPASVIPAWLHCDAPTETPDTKAVTPSGLLEDDPVSVAAMGHGDGLAQALARGRLVHRLMQSLPDIPAEHRTEAARRHIERKARDFTAEECDRIGKDVLSILADARFATLFAPGSRAEVPIVGHIPRTGRAPLAVSAQIDRLAVTPDAVLIADYKTNRPAPRRLEDVPPPYIRQLALYRALLAKLYPDRPVRAALIWTDVADLMEIPAETMEGALAAFTSR